LDKYVNIETMMGMAKEAPFEDIDTFRVSNGIDINDTDHNGHTLLYAAIRFQNDAVLQGAIENGADIHKEISYGYISPSEPVDFAVLSNNRNAVMALIKAGAHLNREQKNTGRDTLPVIAVRSGNVPALKLITEFSDIDLTGLMIPMSWSPAIPALKFARDRKMTEMVQYLESLTTGSIAQ
jgi:ankyrin repeat protein